MRDRLFVISERMKLFLFALGIVAFISPKVIGGKFLRSPVEELGLLRMDQALELKRVRWRMFDEDACLEGYLRDV